MACLPSTFFFTTTPAITAALTRRGHRGAASRRPSPVHPQAALLIMTGGRLLGVGAYTVVGWWWADPVGALAMLPIMLWQGRETLAEARERADRKD